MNILFVIPPKQNISKRDMGAIMSSPDIGVAYMAAFLRSQGHSVSVLDYTVTAFDPEEFRELLRMKRPGMAGFTALTARVHDAAYMAEEYAGLWQEPSVKVKNRGPFTSSGNHASSAIFSEWLPGRKEQATVRPSC